MKRTSPIFRNGIALAAALVTALHAQSASAEGVAAGTPIENTAEATYTSGGETQVVPSNTVVVRVDEILDVVVTSLDGGNVALTDAGAVLTFQLTNTGNGPEAYTIEADPALAGDDFDPAVTRIAYDSNGDGIYEEGVDTIIPVGGATPVIDADASLTLFVITAFGSDVPEDGNTADVRLTATAVTGTGTPGTVFAGEGVDGVDAVVGTTTAKDDDIGTLIAQLAGVTLQKSATVDDQFGGSQTVPGATVTYSLLATVSGSASITDLIITDPIPAGTTYTAGTLTLEGSALTDAADTDAGEADGTIITVDLGTVAGGESRTITFSVTIDN